MLVFCRDIWHCRPSEFYQESVTDLYDALACMNGEAQARAAQHALNK